MTVAKAMKNAAIGNNLRIAPDGGTTVPTFVGLGGKVVIGGDVDDINLRMNPDGGITLPAFVELAAKGGAVGVGGTFPLVPVELILHFLVLITKNSKQLGFGTHNYD